MPYLVYRLLPVVAAAGVAAGSLGPLRAASTGMQFQYYAQSTMGRLSGTSDPESTDSYSHSDHQSARRGHRRRRRRCNAINGCWRIGRGTASGAGTLLRPRARPG